MRMRSEYQSTLNLLIRAMATSITLGMLALAQESDSLLERVAPFWRIGAGFETRLMLNNTQAAPRIVRFEVFDSSGRRVPARELTLGPLESTEVDLGDLTGGRNGYGQISLRHDGRPLEVAAHVMVMHRGRGLVFDEHFQMRSQFLGSRLVGTSDLGVNSAASLLVVANTGGERRRVTVQAVSGGRRGTMNLTLGPHETQTVPFGALFREPESAERNPSDTAVAIEVEHDGARGEVLVQGLLMGPQGLAANMRFADRAKLVSRRALSPVLRLHPGQRSRLALYNLGPAPLSISPVVRYRTGKFVGRLPLAPLALAAREVRGDELTAALAALPPGAQDLGLSLEYEGAPGSLVAEVLMIDPRSGNVVPASPKDVEGEGSVGMTFAWRLHDTSSTVIALANPSADKEIPVQLILFFDGKTYALDGVGSLQPGEVKHFDIRRLRDEQVPGQGGVLIPPGVMKGQAKALVRNELGQDYKILGQAISVGTQGPTPGSLGCALCPPDPSHVVLSPGSFTGNVGTNQQIYPWIYWSDQSSFINNNPYAIDWYPANSSVATVSEAWYNFRVQFLSPGTTTIDATMPNECHYEYDWFYGSCVCSYYLPVWALAPTQVTTVCPVPTGETTTSVGWADAEGLPAVHKFVQQLQPVSSSFAGRTVTESDSSPATDSCWFQGSPFPQVPGVTGGTWSIGSDNRWGPDYVGWGNDLFRYYQSQRVARGLPMPCDFNMFQKLTVSSCGGNSSPSVYRTYVLLRGVISATGASSERDGVLVGRPLIIQ